MTDDEKRSTRDARIDKVTTWLLAAFVGLSLAVGAWFFRDLTGSVKTLNESVSGLRTEVAVLTKSNEAIGEVKADIRELRERLRRLETR